MAGNECEAVFVGRTVQEAVANGAARLGVRVDEANVEILEEGVRGWLGFRAREARVRVGRLTKGAAAERLLRRLAELMGSTVDVKIEGPSGERPGWLVSVASDDPAQWIGRRGQTLDALRVWCDAAATRMAASRERLAVDVAGYRERRESALRFAAKRAGDQVRRSGREVELEAMGAADRRVVHMTLQNVEGIRTESVGEEPFRRVVIRPVV